MAKKETNIEALIIQNPELKDSLLQLNSVKSQLSAEAQKLDKIEITDETSLSVLEQSMSKLNDLTKAVEAKRVALKAPHLDRCNAIDAAAKYVSNEPNESIKKAKEKKLVWINLQAKHKANYDNFVSKYENSISSAKTIDELRKISNELCFYKSELKTLNEINNIKNVYGKYASLIKSLTYKYISLSDIKKIELDNIKNASPDEIEAIKESMAEAQEKIQEIQSAPEETRIKGQRKTWVFEVSDMQAIPYNWLKVDEEVVKDWLSVNKDILKDGEIVKGIKFYQKTSVTI